MRILLVGAGAVGQIYGKYLHRGGAEVTFFVREKYAAECKEGFVTWRARPGRKARPERWSDFDVVTTPAEVAQRSFDQVWLCISTTALRGPWFDDLVTAMHEGATLHEGSTLHEGTGLPPTLVTLQPGLEERDWLAQRVPPEQTVCGMIGIVSYQAPLEGERVPEPGVAYWFPPLTPSPFSGPADRRDPIVAMLKRGGMPVSVVDDASAAAAIPTAIMMPHLAALEAADWSFDRLARDERLALASEAAREGIVIAARHHGRPAPWWRRMIGPWLIRLITRLGPMVAPLPLETYLRYHFTKVGDQTRYLLRSTIDVGDSEGLPVKASRDLLARCFDRK